MSAEPEAWDIQHDVRGYVWRSPGARANVLLQHGFAEYAQRYVKSYSGLVLRLNELGFDVYAFDLRGHGQSPGKRGDTDIREAVAHHRAARSVLASQSKPLFLFGHSLGGLITAASVAEDDSDIAGVVLSAPSLPGNIPAPMAALITGFGAMMSRLGVAPAIDGRYLSRIPEAVEDYVHDPLVRNVRISGKLIATSMAVARELETKYKTWRVPTLILHGGDDRAADPQGSQRLFSAIASTDKHLELYPDARHELLNDLDRDAALTLMQSWFRTRLDTPPL
jgi:acylglycerol lipase